MLLKDGIVLIGTLRLRLDPALGVVYERMDASPGEPDDASV
jgi:hypothetical protein